MADRQVTPNLPDLMDRLTIQQIKEIADPDNKESYAGLMAALEHDLDMVLAEGQVRLDAELIRLVIALAQTNLHIWFCRDKMAGSEEEFPEQMKLSHQLNGIRNQLKNRLLEKTNSDDKAGVRTNTDQEDLAGWDLSILLP